MKIKDEIYLHSDKMDMRDQFTDLCKQHNIEPSETAINKSAYTGYEVGFNVEWDTDTGDCKFIDIIKT